MRSKVVVLPAGFEPAISGLRTRNPGPLDDDSVIKKKIKKKVAPGAGLEPAGLSKAPD
jgi:hypothetical protein